MVQKIDVSNELKKIQDAVYGEEVRSSIYDGIKKAADTTNLIIEEWTDVNDSMVSLKNSLEASESQRLTNEETRKTQETKRQQDTSKAIQEINKVRNTVEQKLNDGEFIGASGVWLGDSVPTADYDVWVKPTDIEGISGLFVRDNNSWFEISSIKGEKGSIPKHEVLEKKIRFENSDGSWGEWIDLSTITASDIKTESGLTIQESLNKYVDYVIESGENYTKWASGKLEQWGIVEGTGATARGNFNVPFTKIQSLIISPRYVGGSAESATYSYTWNQTETPSSFIAYVRKVDGSSPAGGHACSYYAIGKWK